MDSFLLFFRLIFKFCFRFIKLEQNIDRKNEESHGNLLRQKVCLMLKVSMMESFTTELLRGEKMKSVKLFESLTQSEE